jgi:hypothetical protein
MKLFLVLILSVFLHTNIYSDISSKCNSISNSLINELHKGSEELTLGSSGITTEQASKIAINNLKKERREKALNNDVIPPEFIVNALNKGDFLKSFNCEERYPYLKEEGLREESPFIDFLIENTDRVLDIAVKDYKEGVVFDFEQYAEAGYGALKVFSANHDVIFFGATRSNVVNAEATMVDILECTNRKKDIWNLTDVMAGSDLMLDGHVRETEILNLAFQWFVLKNSGFNIDRVFVKFVNRHYVMLEKDNVDPDLFLKQKM